MRCELPCGLSQIKEQIKNYDGMLENPNMKTISLTKGKVALVDDEDYPELSKHRWCAHKFKNTYYAERSSPRDPITHSRNHIQMHAIIAGTPKGMDTDHINGNGLDNRRENLRVVTRRQNCQNFHQEKSSKFPGITWHKRDRKWQARIWVNGKRHFLGYHDDEETAGIVYAMACNALKIGCVL